MSLTPPRRRLGGYERSSCASCLFCVRGSLAYFVLRAYRAGVPAAHAAAHLALLVRLRIEAATRIVTTFVTVQAFAAALVAIVPFQLGFARLAKRLCSAVLVE